MSSVDSLSQCVRLMDRSTLSSFNSIVNPFSPYPEPAGANEADKYQAIRLPLTDYGSYITSCASLCSVCRA